MQLYTIHTSSINLCRANKKCELYTPEYGTNAVQGNGKNKNYSSPLLYNHTHQRPTLLSNYIADTLRE